MLHVYFTLSWMILCYMFISPSLGWSYVTCLFHPLLDDPMLHVYFTLSWMTLCYMFISPSLGWSYVACLLRPISVAMILGGPRLFRALPWMIPFLRLPIITLSWMIPNYMFISPSLGMILCCMFISPPFGHDHLRSVRLNFQFVLH